MRSNDFSLFITPLKLGSRWNLETGLPTHNLHFPEEKQKGNVAFQRVRFFVVFSLIWHVMVLRRGELRWHHCPAWNRAMLVLSTCAVDFGPGVSSALRITEWVLPLWHRENSVWGQHQYTVWFYHLSTKMRKPGYTSLSCSLFDGRMGDKLFIDYQFNWCFSCSLCMSMV